MTSVAAFILSTFEQRICLPDIPINSSFLTSTPSIDVSLIANVICPVLTSAKEADISSKLVSNVSSGLNIIHALKP